MPHFVWHNVLTCDEIKFYVKALYMAYNAEQRAFIYMIKDD